MYEFHRRIMHRQTTRTMMCAFALHSHAPRNALLRLPFALLATVQKIYYAANIRAYTVRDSTARDSTAQHATRTVTESMVSVSQQSAQRR